MNPYIFFTLVDGLDNTLHVKYVSISGSSKNIIDVFTVKYQVSAVTDGEMMPLHASKDFVLLKMNALIFFCLHIHNHCLVEWSHFQRLWNKNILSVVVHLKKDHSCRLCIDPSVYEDVDTATLD